MNKSYENLYILNSIVKECDIIVSQYCGGTWIWFNDEIIECYIQKNKPVYLIHPMCGVDYSRKMNTWIKRYYDAIYKDSPSEYHPVISFVELSDIATKIRE